MAVFFPELAAYGGAISPPPGLEPPSSCPSVAATVSESDLVSIYKEFLQMRRERLDYELNAAVPEYGEFKNNTSLGIPIVSVPHKPPGVFLKSVSRTSLVSMSTAATMAGDIEDTEPADEKSKTLTEEVYRDLCVEHLGTDGHLRVTMRVHGNKLRSKDQQIVSSSFEIAGCSFKLMLKPTPMGEKKGQACFRKARGSGSVDLKMVDAGGAAAPSLRFCITLGGGTARGPISHDFNDSIVGSLARNDQSFDFASAVDPKSGQFVVTLDVVPSAP